MASGLKDDATAQLAEPCKGTENQGGEKGALQQGRRELEMKIVRKGLIR